MITSATTNRSTVWVVIPSDDNKLWSIEGETRLPDCVMVELGTSIDISGIDPELCGKCYVSGLEIQPIVFDEKYQTLVTWKAFGEIKRIDGEPLCTPGDHPLKY